MKKKSFNLSLMAAILLTAFSTACSKEDPINPPTPPVDDTLLKGELLDNKTLESGKTYKLSGDYTVKAPAVLTIQAGVTIEAIDDNIIDYILVEQGAKVEANGSSDKPIIMTAQKKVAGAWGGIHICGKAPINVNGGIGKSEIGDAPYGGATATDNSGTYRYIRIEYAGVKLDADHEANGFTLYGVGNGTKIEYCQAYKGTDDGFEFFGGTVNVRNLISTSNSDDSFDWTEGWCGKGQFLIAFQEEAKSLGYECDRLMECDNNSKNNAANPVSHPILANITLIGNNSADENKGISLRAGTQVELYNALVTGKKTSMTVETSQTETALKSGISKLESVYLSNKMTSKEGIFQEADFLASGNNAQNFDIASILKGYVGIVKDGKTDLPSVDKFFENAPYVGAVQAEKDWTINWSK